MAGVFWGPEELQMTKPISIPQLPKEDGDDFSWVIEVVHGWYQLFFFFSEFSSRLFSGKIQAAILTCADFLGWNHQLECYTLENPGKTKSKKL